MKNKSGQSGSKVKGFAITLKMKLTIAFLLILLIPSLAISAVSFYMSYRSMEAQLDDSAQESVKIANSIVESTIVSKVNDVHYFTSTMNGSMIDGSHSPKIEPILRQYVGLHPDTVDIFVGTPDGLMIRGVPKKSEDGYDPRKREWYKNALQKPGETIFTPVVVNSSGIPVVIVAKTLPDQSGVLGISINLETLRKLTNIRVGREGYVVILDSMKKYIVHPTIKPGTAGSGELVTRLYAAAGGQFEYELAGQAKKLHYTTNQTTGWKIVGVMSRSEVIAAISDMRNVTGLVVIAALLLAVISIFFLIRSIVGPIRRLQNGAELIRRGDLTERVEVRGSDEISQLARNFQIMVDNLRAMIMAVRETTDRVNTSAEGLAVGAEQTTKAIEHVTLAIQEVAEGSEQQAQGLLEGSGNMEAVSGQVKDVTDQIRAMAETVKETSRVSVEGNAAADQAVQEMYGVQHTVDHLSNAMQALDARSVEINGIVAVIAGIAKQTNLLALNAAIEAARAGEQGRGFAVVAHEVRKLAEESAQSAALIAERIGAIQTEMGVAREAMHEAKSRVTDSVQAVSETGNSFAKIRDAIGVVDSNIEGIRMAALEMEQGTAAVVQVMADITEISAEAASSTQSISAAAEEQLASVEEISSSAVDLSRMAEQLQELVRRFKV